MKHSIDFKRENERNEFKTNYQEFSETYRTQMTPVGILQDNGLTAYAKVLFLIISGLSFKHGYCFATNEGLSTRLGASISSVKKYLKELEDKKLIINKRVIWSMTFRRKLYVNFDELKERCLPFKDSD